MGAKVGTVSGAQGEKVFKRLKKRREKKSKVVRSGKKSGKVNKKAQPFRTGRGLRTEGQ